MESLAFWLHNINEIVWGPWLLILIIGTGIYLLIRMRFLPFRRFFYALKCAITSENSQIPRQTDHRFPVEKATPSSTLPTGSHGKISPLASLTTELAATIGTGNIVGVATAMVLGGPGALVWMILSSFIGLSTKFAESMLSVKYRTKNTEGQIVGGPMYTLQAAFPRKKTHRSALLAKLDSQKTGRFLACLFALFAVFASFGMGNMTQANSIALALKESFDVSEGKTALFLSLLVILVILGGIQSISRLNLYLVPFMALVYVIGGIIVLFLNAKQLPEGLSELLRMAFSTEALAGGMGGSIIVSMQDALRFGVSRGVFSNEAGLGAGGITAAAADTKSPVRQGYISMTGVFFDTILMCTLTGLVIASSGVLGLRDETGELLTGSALAIAAFSSTLGSFGEYFVSLGISLFAFATIIAWAYQGERAFEFLVKKPERCIWYRFVYALMTFVGATTALEVVWDFSDIMNGLMAVPNLICILVLSGEVCREMREYEKNKKG